MSINFENLAVIEEALSPNDQHQVTMDISEWLDTDTIDSVAFTAVDASGRAATATALDAGENTWTNTVIKPYILGGGSSGKRYTIKCLVTTVAGDKKAFYLKFKTKELAQ